MSWLSAPASGDWSEASAWHSEEGLAPFVTLSGTPTQRPSSWHGWKARTWSVRLFSMTSPRSTLDAGVGLWISSLLASRVSPGPSPASGEERQTHGGSGQTSPELSESASPGSCSSKMSPDSFGMASPSCWRILPRSGSMLNGRVYERQTLALRTEGNGCSFWPTADANTSTYSNGERGPNLRQAAKCWPTPHGFQAGNGLDGNEFSTAIRNWPTPQAMDAQNARRLRLKTDRASRGATIGDYRGDLKDHVLAWATPQARDVKGQDMPHRKGTPSLPDQVMRRAGELGLTRMVLNPQFVETLMGFRIGWTACAASATPSCHSRPPSHSECLPSGLEAEA